MKKIQARIDWMNVGVTTAIFTIPTGILIVAIAASFAHIKDWALHHAVAGTHQWQGWAFACIVELVPIFGVLTMWKLRKARHSLTVPRWILGSGFGLSMAGQVAYAGGLSAGVSRLIVAAGPSIAGLILTEVLLWLVRVVAEGDKAAPPAPTLVPAPPAVIPAPPAPASPLKVDAAPLDMTPSRTPERLTGSPWATPPGADVRPPGALPERQAAAPSQDAAVDGEQPQVTATVPPQLLPDEGGERGEQGTQERTPDEGGEQPADEEEDVPQDKEGSTDAPEDEDTGGDPGGAALSPGDIDLWKRHRNGATKKQLAAELGVHEKTIQRRLAAVRKVVEAAGDPLTELTGATAPN